MSLMRPTSLLCTASLLAGCGDPVVVADYLTVVGVAPSHGSVGVSPDTTVRATFNAPISPDSPRGMTLESPQGDPVSAVVEFDSDTWTLVLLPDEPLDDNATYTLHLADSLYSEELGSLPATVSSTFATYGGALQGNHAPTATISFNALCVVGQELQLDALESADADGDPLTWAWRIAEAPEGQAPELGPLDAELTLLTPWSPGLHVVGLVVDDGQEASSEAFAELDCR